MPHLLLISWVDHQGLAALVCCQPELLIALLNLHCMNRSSEYSSKSLISQSGHHVRSLNITKPEMVAQLLWWLQHCSL